MCNRRALRGAGGHPWAAVIVAGGAGLCLVQSAWGQVVEPPGYILYYGAASGTPDGNLSNPSEWFQVETNYPNNAVPGGSDAASVSVPGLGLVYGSLDCWGAGVSANNSSLLIQASISTGVGGLAISGDPYSTGETTLQAAASTSGIFDTDYRVNLDAPVDVGQCTYMQAGDQGVNINLNAGLTTNGLNVEDGATLNVASGATVTTGQVGSLQTNFYCETTALQVDGPSAVAINGGSVTCNGDVVIGTVPADSSQTYYGELDVSDGGTLTTSGVTLLGVTNANTAEGAAGPGSGLMLVSGAHSLWEAQDDISVGASTAGSAAFTFRMGGR